MYLWYAFVQTWVDYARMTEVTGLFKKSPALFSYKHSEYITPRKLYKEYDDVYHFTLDPCMNESNPLGTPKFYTEKDDGLKQSWAGECVYCNPPYHSKNIIKWIEKARNSKARLVVCFYQLEQTQNGFMIIFTINPMWKSGLFVVV